MELLSPDGATQFVACFLGIVLLVVFAFEIYVLVLVFKDRTLTGGQKVAWAIAILMLNLPGASLYLLLGRGKGSNALPGEDA